MSELEKQNMLNHRPDYQRSIIDLIESSASPKYIRDRLDDYHANDIAETIEQMVPDQRSRLIKMMDARQLSDVFEYLDENLIADIISSMNIRKIIAVLNIMEPHEANRLLSHTGKEKRKIITELLEPEVRDELMLLGSYSPEQMGAHMDTNFVELKKSMTVPEAMRSLRQQAEDTDEISLLYVVDENGQYYGAISISELFAARLNDDLDDIIQTNFPVIYASDDIDQVIDAIKDYEEDSLPVLASDNRIVGILPKSEMLDLISAEQQEDYARLAGLSRQEDLNENLFVSMKKRLPWLMILLFLSLGVSAVVSMFEGVVAKLTITVAFQSLVLDMAGNVGTQSLAVSIRVLSDDALSASEKLKLVFKEARTGFVNGIILGGFSALLLGPYIHFANGYAWGSAFAIAFCIGFAMLCAMVISSLTGTLIPIAFDAMHIDPAAASGPLITTLNDLIGVISYYGLVWIFLIHILHLV